MLFWSRKNSCSPHKDRTELFINWYKSYVLLQKSVSHKNRLNKPFEETALVQFVSLVCFWILSKRIRSLLQIGWINWNWTLRRIGLLQAIHPVFQREICWSGQLWRPWCIQVSLVNITSSGSAANNFLREGPVNDVFRHWCFSNSWKLIQVKILPSLFRVGPWPLRPHSGCASDL